MAKDFYDQIVARLRAAGCWQIDGGKGSHDKWCSPISGRVFTVPRSKSRHTANEVLKQAGLKKGF
ncbi:type II toxin-antitoxin system HicA family toxin [Brevundimonas sp.]|uniref:type II toxin-antitoxin system HicA family toxin n=1 Tax=Brevundimonas sp. TaxID=1871086 RepID=UPI00344CCA09